MVLNECILDLLYVATLFFLDKYTNVYIKNFLKFPFKIGN